MFVLAFEIIGSGRWHSLVKSGQGEEISCHYIVANGTQY